MQRTYAIAISLMATAAVILFVLVVCYSSRADEGFRIDSLSSRALKSHLSTRAGEVTGLRHSYSIAGIAVTDVGNVRIAIRGLKFGGTSSGNVMISSSRPYESVGHTGSGNRRYTSYYKDGMTTCTFGGLRFTIKNGILELLGERFDIVNDKPKVILVGLDGKIERTMNIE